jgi:hypothetical protein
VGLRAQHVGIFRVQLLDTGCNVLPERWPEKHIVILTGGRRWLTSGGYKGGLLRPAYRRGTADLEEVLHVHRGRLPSIPCVRFIFFQSLQTIEILPAQQSIQVRRLLGTDQRESPVMIYSSVMRCDARDLAEHRASLSLSLSLVSLLVSR